MRIGPLGCHRAQLTVATSVHYGHHTIKPDADRLYEIYQAWIEAIQDVADVEGIRPTLILNNSPASAMTVSKTNGIGNTFGLDDDQSYVCTYLTSNLELVPSGPG